MALYALTIFLSAFLLFQVQPLIAKTILAWFGGSAAVWTTCMLFFQMELLLGYFYADFSIRKLDPKRQALVHTILLGAACLLIPIIPAERWKPVGGSNPTVAILLLLAATVGLPYLLCSTTGPLVQAWYARREKGAAPYQLFALSNLGSMLALLSYPVLVEPHLATKAQAWIWSGAFVVFAILCAGLAWRSSNSAPLSTVQEEESIPDDPPGVTQKLLWVALAACPSLLMLAVTNHLTQDVAAIPFLWVLPLSLYLLSFILTFDARGWYRRNLFLVLLAPAIFLMAFLQWSARPEVIRGFNVSPSMPWTIVIYALSFFVACMLCHGELASRKPQPRFLTSFYLMLSVGGAIGGLFVGLIAPYLFPAYFELPIGILLLGILAWAVSADEAGQQFRKSILSSGSICLALGVIALGVFLVRSARDEVSGYMLVERNFYGTLRIRDTDFGQWEGYRTLMHGSINHGEQWTDPARRRDLLTYYCATSGIGRAMQTRREGVPAKVGVLGLGAGTMAAFGRPGDDFRFYEINPMVPKLATHQFTFVPDSRAKTQIVMGDGRLSLEAEPPNGFDVLMMDAFSGDSIPVHLVTREAFELYFRHLKADGIIVVHISNKYLDLQPVLARITNVMGKAALVVENEDDDAGNCFGTTYVLVANSAAVFDRPELQGAGRKPELKPEIGLWTDDFSNLFQLLR